MTSPVSSETESRVSGALWLGYNDIAAWRNFVQHDFSHPSRPIAYATVKSLLKKKRLTFCEVGFGGAFDFKTCFKELHDTGKIQYTGMDYMGQFVGYAQQDYPEYTWKQGEFKDLEPLSFDVLYTRHTMQHQSPGTYQDCIRKFVGAARKYALVVWHPPLGQEHIHFEHQGYCNTWDRATVDALIRDCGFSIEIIPADEDELYVLRRL